LLKVILKHINFLNTHRILGIIRLNENQKIMIYIILIEPETEGNVGAVARVMKNFGFSRLVLINPKADIKSEETRNRAKHAQDILKNAEIAGWDYLDKMDYLVATTAKLGTDYNIPRSPMTPDQLAEKIDIKQKIGIVIGREGLGLTNEEIGKCDFVVSIPADTKYPTLNISHALGIILYELYKKCGKLKSNSHIVVADKQYKDVLTKKTNELLDKLTFTTIEKKETQQIVWKRIFGKAMLTKREAFAVLGFLSKVNKKIK
jgi:TrmH family RNA methyltransferase